MPSLAIVVILALAAYRAARFVTHDTLTGPFRGRLYTWAWDASKPTTEWVDGAEMEVPSARAAWRTYVYELFTCAHCIAVWIAAAFYLAWRYGGTAILAFLTVVAVAGAASLFTSWEPK